MRRLKKACFGKGVHPQNCSHALNAHFVRVALCGNALGHGNVTSEPHIVLLLQCRKKSWPFACEFEHLKLFKGYIDEDEERHKFGHKGAKVETKVLVAREEEVQLLKNLSHPNIVRYLGTVRESDSLNIMMQFVPGGSISSLLAKFGSFPEPVSSDCT
ncbi:unnamed protein product [Arabidopsis thaliana]|uniref:Protein kinase domain-containing protein n=1 Tax=Arabidopsis thaliana TaxID=3702 RepID=A0A5S9X6S2_ARATH|nr:unnamed protein product [Arabidopsis thaliana]